eukprot:g773.t1
MVCISQELLTEVRQSARKWFALPIDVKRKIQASPTTHFRGYQALGENITNYENGFSRDHHEAIDFFKEMTVDPQDSLIHGPNLWPNADEDFSYLLKEYFNQMKELGIQVVSGISLGLGLEANAFESYSDDPYWGARVLHYPPLCEGHGHQGSQEGTLLEEAQNAVKGSEVSRTIQLSCGEHSDYGMLTFVNQDDHITALQVKNASGEWINAQPIPGSLVCNIGDMYNILTNGKYTATRHRVLNTEKKASRVSIAFFFEPNFNVRIEPLEAFLTPGQDTNKQGIKYGTHLEGKVYQNFDFFPAV